MWTNLGDWQHSTAYGAAAQALATRVGVAAGLREDDVVVDYACGFGDSLRLWLERFGVRRVVGVEPDPSVCDVIRRRVAQWGLQDRVTIMSARAELLAPRRAAPDVSAVVSVDAAYHFRSRLSWWRMLATDLPRGARIACSDLFIAEGRRVGVLGRSLAGRMGIPAENLVSASALRDAIQAAGASHVQITACGPAVLDGFVTHAPTTGVGLRVTKASIRALRRRHMIEYAIVSATTAQP